MVTGRNVLIALVIAFVGAGAAEAAGPPRIPVPQRKFDHARHEAAAAGAKEGKRQKAACADCHQMDAKGVRKTGKEHDFRCVKCHDDPETCTAAMKSSAATSPGRRCVVCHQMKQCVPPNLPPAPTQDSFQAGFDHPKHIGFGAAIEKECATCHKEQAPAGTPVPTAGGAGHALCSDCHKVGGRSKLEMTNCAGCHKPPMSRAANSDPYRLATFDHQKHHAAATKNAAPCTTCHSKLKEGSPTGTVPRPDMKSCLDSCHNGTKAFSAVGTKCTVCHTAQNGKPTPNETKLVFSHAAHLKRNVDMKNCAACHSIKTDGNLEPPGEGKQHMPCAASGCHQTEYLQKSNKICGVCHNESMPWQKAVARMNDSKGRPSEYFENINHSSHLAKKGTTNSACGDCHGDKLGGGKKPGDHEPCIQCHGKGAPAHDMTECGKCHFATPPARMQVSEWSVAATFVHEKHATDPKTRKTSQCAGCHADVKNAKDLSTIKKPTMQSCDACHDGKSAFKTTGYECSRCHTKANKPSTPQASTGFNAANRTAMLEVRTQ